METNFGLITMDNQTMQGYVDEMKREIIGNPNPQFEKHGIYVRANMSEIYSYENLKVMLKHSFSPVIHNMYLVMKKRRKSMPKKGKKYSIRKVFTVTNVTDTSFKIQ